MALITKNPKIVQIVSLLSGRECPEEYKDFFFRWSIFNAVYNGMYQGKGDKKKVRRFGRDACQLWSFVAESTKEFVKEYCIGEKSSKFDRNPLLFAPFLLNVDD